MDRLVVMAASGGKDPSQPALADSGSANCANSTPLQFLASSPRGLSDLLARELSVFGAQDVRERSTGVEFSGSLEVAYRACLWSRVANRVFLPLGRFEVSTADAFYAAVREIDWSAHIGPGATLACDFSGRHPAITHTHFGALKLKDAIVDSVRAQTGSRPDVELERPSVRVHAHAHGNTITVSLDLSGESLHRRGYRGATGEAPLKENVAAGVLIRAGWPEWVARVAGRGQAAGLNEDLQPVEQQRDSGAVGRGAGESAEQGDSSPGEPGGSDSVEQGDRAPVEFLDPMCGSGTFVIEAALIVADRAPGLTRDYFGFLGWKGHDAALWKRLRTEAQARSHTDASPNFIIRGQDRDAFAIRSARQNAQRAGVEALVRFDVKPLSEAAPASRGGAAAPGAGHPALLCTNPPYGIRLEDRDTARAIHRELGAVLRERFQGWNAAVLTGAPELGMELGLRAHRTHTVWNGAIECRLLRLRVAPESLREPGTLAKADSSVRDSPGAKMFANRLGKNLKRLQGWAKSAGVSCYRVYDADMPEYAFAIDIYRTLDPDQNWLYVQEYAAPATIELDAVRRRRREALSTLPDVTGVPPDRIHVRTRRKVKRGEQYRKVDDQASFHRVEEGGLKFRVNFDDYLDTGLFLDHRVTRKRIREAADGKRFLNLFAYTGTATVYAAAGGAASTTSVDMSRTYLDWAQRNLALNGFTGRQHALVQADCLHWLRDNERGGESYDLIFLDPPTFSNSKRMEGVLDVERDHPVLIDACAKLLAPDGLLIFSTNAQRFRLDESLSTRYAVRDISPATLPKDFERNPRIHRCFEVRLAGGAAAGSSSGRQGLPSFSSI